MRHAHNCQATLQSATDSTSRREGRALGETGAFALLSAILLVAAYASTAQAQNNSLVARVIATSDIDGRFAQPVCQPGRTLLPAEHANFTYALTRAAHADDRPLVVDMGGLLTPDGVVRFAAEHDPESVAMLIDELGYRALALAAQDLAAPRPGFRAVVESLRARNIPMIASNLRCAPEIEGFCDALVDASDGLSIHAVADQMMGVIAVIGQREFAMVPPARAAGITIEDPIETIQRFTQQARERGVDFVVAVVSPGSHEDGALGVAAALDEDLRPDLLLAADNGDQLLFARPPSMVPVIVSAPTEDAIEVRIRESQELDIGHEMLAQPLGHRGITAGEPVSTWIAEIGEAYCEAWGTPLPGGTLDEPMDVNALTELIADIVRTETGADIAILHHELIDERWRAANPNALTESDLYVAIEYDESISTTVVDQAWLNRLAAVAEHHPELIVRGLSWSPSATGYRTRVVGHRTNATAPYRIATIRALAVRTGDPIPALPRGRRWERYSGSETIRGLVRNYLLRPSADDPRFEVPNNDESIQWLFDLSASLNFSGTNVHNHLPCAAADRSGSAGNDCDPNNTIALDAAGAPVRAYTASQLGQTSAASYGINVNLSANAAAPDWTWQNSLLVNYRMAWIEPSYTSASANDFSEAADQIEARSTVAWKGLRQQGEWYIPDPTFEMFLVTEFTRPETRRYHALLLRPTVGTRFQLLPKLQLQLNAGLSWQRSDRQADGVTPVTPAPGIGATLTLRPWTFMRFGARFARASFTFDYFVSDIGNQNDHVLRGQLDASIDLVGPLSIVLSSTLYLQESLTPETLGVPQVSQGIGLALSATAGLRIGTVQRALNF